jgi:hypothetical protein
VRAPVGKLEDMRVQDEQHRSFPMNDALALLFL